jgi:hypothetical protein
LFVDNSTNNGVFTILTKFVADGSGGQRYYKLSIVKEGYAEFRLAYAKTFDGDFNSVNGFKWIYPLQVSTNSNIKGTEEAKINKNATTIAA